MPCRNRLARSDSPPYPLPNHPASSADATIPETQRISTAEKDTRPGNMPSATTTAAAVIPTDVNNLSSYSLRPSSRPAPLLTSIDCVGQVHLVVGGNSLAAARIAKALDSGAIVKLISPPRDEEEGGLPSTLLKRVQDGQVEWIRREFVKEDLTTLGREEVDRVVDRVFVTLPVECAQCKLNSFSEKLGHPVWSDG